MSELEEKLGSILRDPNMMQQIMGMAQMLSGGQGEAATEALPANRNTSPPKIDESMIQAISSLAGQGGIDSNQDSLLKALHPYLSSTRINKLERAMSAARMANAASAFLNAGGGKLLGLR